jgi:protein involved in polysaccharide export with SLBB domain
LPPIRTKGWSAAAGVCGAFLALAGCSTGPGGSRFTLFPEGHHLTGAAKDARTAFSGPQALPRELDKHVAPLFAAEPGDVLLVQPANLDSPARFPGDQPVLPDGTINLGHYGLLPVAGRTVPDIEAQVKARIEEVMRAEPPPKEPRDGAPRGDWHDIGPITVRVVTRQSKVYYVLGEVNAPGSFTLKGNETVLDGILSAGGLTERASRRNIILSRPTPPNSCRVVLPVCYLNIVQLGDTGTNYQLAAGDRIYVPTREHGEPCGDDKKKKKQDCPLCGGPQVPCPGLPVADRGCGFKPALPGPDLPAPIAPPRTLDAPEPLTGPAVTPPSPESSSGRR